MPIGARGRFYTVVDPVNRLEAESRAGRQGRLADHLCRMDFVVLDELGYLPFAQSGGQLRVAEKIENFGKQERPGASEVQRVEVAQPGLLSSVAANAPDAAARGLFALVLLLFLLSSGDLFYAKIVRAMPTLGDKKKALGIALDIERELSRYLGTITLINAGLGVCVGLALWTIGIQNPMLWGALAGAGKGGIPWTIPRFNMKRIANVPRRHCIADHQNRAADGRR